MRPGWDLHPRIQGFADLAIDYSGTRPLTKQLYPTNHYLLISKPACRQSLCYHISVKKLIVILVASVILGGCTIRNPFLKKPAGLSIATTTPSVVFINGEEKGQAPFSNQDLKPGSYSIKLVPEGGVDGQNFSLWETSVDLRAGATTIINHTFAELEVDSFGSVLELRQDVAGKTYLSIVTDPDTVNVSLDGKPSGYTPLSKIEVSPGSHQLLLTSPGYKEQELAVQAVKDYNLIVNAKLASDTITLTTPPPEASASSPSAEIKPEVTEDEVLKPYVVIGDTGTGWLRVRSEPSSTGDELGKVNVDEKLKYLGESTETGWYKVEFEGSPGWISGKYATIVK